MTTRRLGALLALAAAGYGCAKGEGVDRGGAGGGARRELRFPVETAAVEARRVEYVVSGVGSVEAYERVHVAARVAGAVERVLFREGDDVVRGQALARIDGERHEIAVRSAKASLARAQAAEGEARTGLERRRALVAERPELLPAEELDAWTTRVQSTAAQVAEARAALDQAELNLKHAHPSAPCAGVIETRSVETGQYVQPGAAIATLLRRDPLLLRFQVPSREARGLERGKVATFTTSGSTTSMRATITHVSQSADASSRLVQLTAEIDAPNQETLRPGTFAQVTVAVGAHDAAAVIPQIAIRSSERGFLAYVVDGDVVHERILELGMRTGDGLVEVTRGLTPGESIVIRGGEALSDGVKVLIANGAPASTAGGGGGPTAKEVSR